MSTGSYLVSTQKYLVSPTTTFPNIADCPPQHFCLNLLIVNPKSLIVNPKLADCQPQITDCQPQITDCHPQHPQLI